MDNTLTIDLRYDIPQDIGYCIPGRGSNNFKKFYGVNDVPCLLDCIASHIKEKRIEQDVQPEELVKFDVIVFGNIHPGIFASMAVSMSGWDDINSLTYLKPEGSPVKVFPVEFE